MTVVLAARHGDVHNPAGVIYARQPGFLLSPRGARQAAALARQAAAAGLDAVHCSPLERAQRTAAPVAAACGVPLVVDERLVEWRHWDAWAGWTFAQLREREPSAFDVFTDPGLAPNGESLRMLADRMQHWLADVQRAHPAGRVLAVTHLEPLRVLLRRARGEPLRDLLAIRVGPGRVVRVAPDPDVRTGRIAALVHPA